MEGQWTRQFCLIIDGSVNGIPMTPASLSWHIPLEHKTLQVRIQTQLINKIFAQFNLRELSEQVIQDAKHT